MAVNQSVRITEIEFQILCQTSVRMIIEAQLQFCQNSLRRRIRDEEASFQIIGVEHCMKAVLDLFTRTFTDGENQSGILIGSCKHTKRCILTQSLKHFERSHGEYCKVYLNGMHLQTETETFKDLLLQLVPDLKQHGVRNPHLRINFLMCSTKLSTCIYQLK